MVVENLGILLQYLRWRQDSTAHQLRAAGAEGVDDRLRQIEGRIGRVGVAEGVFERLIGGEEGAGGWDGDEDDGADSLVQTAEEGWVEMCVAGEKGGWVEAG